MLIFIYELRIICIIIYSTERPNKHGYDTRTLIFPFNGIKDVFKTEMFLSLPSRRIERIKSFMGLKGSSNWQILIFYENWGNNVLKFKISTSIYQN